MSDPTTERLYTLLPTIYRQRDSAQGEPLRTLLAVIEQELRALEDAIEGLYESWFIETCAEWAVPAIGDLLGIRGLSSETREIFSQRAYVVNAISYRRRKGTADVLARVARDVSGWSVCAVEFFRLLGAMQHLHNLRPGQGATVDLRDRSALARLGTPFTTTAHQADIRRIASNRGTHNIANLGLFVWRLQSFPLARVSPKQSGAGCYTFSATGVDQQLFIRPLPPAGQDAPIELWNLPAPLTQVIFADDMLHVQREGGESYFYGGDRSLCVYSDGQAVPAGQVRAADLSGWRRPQPGSIAVDVVLGRLAFAQGEEPQGEIAVSASYGFSTAIGGGPYDRRHTLAAPGADTWRASIPADYATLQQALAAWPSAQPRATIQISDNRTYAEPITIDLAGRRQLTIEAADGCRPCLADQLRMSGDAGAALTLNGLLIGGQLLVMTALQLVCVHCTLQAGVASVKTAAGVQVTIIQSITGPLRLPADAASLSVQDSVIDGGPRQAGGDNAWPAPAGYAIAAAASGEQPGPPVALERVTVFGQVHVVELAASEVIFTDLVTAQRRQSGMLRFSYLPAGSRTPQRYRCQPDLAIDAEELAVGRLLDEAERAEIRSRVRPAFSSTSAQDPGYAQLSQACPLEIAVGAENGAEIGVFNSLLQPQRAANLRAVLDEYLPVGLEAGVIYLT